MEIPNVEEGVTHSLEDCCVGLLLPPELPSKSQGTILPPKVFTVPASKTTWEPTVSHVLAGFSLLFFCRTPVQVLVPKLLDNQPCKVF